MHSDLIGLSMFVLQLSSKFPAHLLSPGAQKRFQVQLHLCRSEERIADGFHVLVHSLILFFNDAAKVSLFFLVL
jgi:hypothetical protein